MHRVINFALSITNILKFSKVGMVKLWLKSSFGPTFPPPLSLTKFCSDPTKRLSVGKGFSVTLNWVSLVNVKATDFCVKFFSWHLCPISYTTPKQYLLLDKGWLCNDLNYLQFLNIFKISIFSKSCWQHLITTILPVWICLRMKQPFNTILC